MGQVSSKLRRGEGRYFHWCPACKELHQLPDRWKFNGDLERPTFSPSFRHSGKATVRDENGHWLGEWKLGPDGKPLDEVCHYILTDGQLRFCSDCTHDFAGRTVPLPDLPPHCRDGAI